MPTFSLYENYTKATANCQAKAVNKLSKKYVFVVFYLPDKITADGLQNKPSAVKLMTKFVIS
ncbi:MAG: hypothetical protein IJN86_08485, partial [Clostridia bacterium]|nr:hypothetical protein [Clostridia bacterium]